MTPCNVGIAGIAGISQKLPTHTCARSRASREGLEHTRNTRIFGGIAAFLHARRSISAQNGPLHPPPTWAGNAAKPRRGISHKGG
jgi:hypothetical protein